MCGRARDGLVASSTGGEIHGACSETRRSCLGRAALLAAFEFEREIVPETKRLNLVWNSFVSNSPISPSRARHVTGESKQSYRGMDYTTPQCPVPPGAKKGQLPLGEPKYLLLSGDGLRQICLVHG